MVLVLSFVKHRIILLPEDKCFKNLTKKIQVNITSIDIKIFNESFI